MTLPYIMTTAQLDEVLKLLDGPDRAVDDRLWRWVNERKLVRGWQYDLKDAPTYTVSLDSALTLLPVVGEPGHLDERADYILQHVNGGMTICAQVATADDELMTFGANAAIAMVRGCIQAHERLAADR